MKFLLKVLALVCLIVMSKLAKDDTIILQNPVATTQDSEAVFTSHNDRAVISESRQLPISVKYEKGSLQFN